ncbi:MAG: hypothetical protein HY016_04885 [Nitrosomonadales bacterium]|nr:hypothetical protein [Nitrosomonadales bacterium]
MSDRPNIGDVFKKLLGNFYESAYSGILYGFFIAGYTCRMWRKWRRGCSTRPGFFNASLFFAERVLDFTQPASLIMRQIRAFGDIECKATINETTIFIHRAKGWVEPHSARHGSVVHSSNLEMVVAAADGFIAITEWGFNAPGSIILNARQ